MPNTLSPSKLMLGADPEFGVLSGKGNLVSLGDMDTCIRSPFGADGCGRIIELRMKPSPTPEGLVHNIKSSLSLGSLDRFCKPTMVWKAGSMCGGESIGGHIHLGHPEIQAFSYDQFDEDKIRSLANTLDLFLAAPVSLIDVPAERKARYGRNYGHLSDFREQPYGLEYRTLGSWLVAPQIALSILTIAKLITDAWLTKEIIFDNDLREYHYSLQDVWTSWARGRQVHRAAILGIYSEVLPYMESLAAYKGNVKLNIVALHNIIRKEENWFCYGRDIRKTWELNFTKRKPSVASIWKEIV